MTMMIIHVGKQGERKMHGKGRKTVGSGEGGSEQLGMHRGKWPQRVASDKEERKKQKKQGRWVRSA